MKLAVLLLGVAACNVAGGDGRLSAELDAASELADAGPPDARPAQEPIACEPGPRTVWAGNDPSDQRRAETTIWWAPLGKVDVARAPRITAWACEFVCGAETDCRRCSLPPGFGTPMTCSYPTEPPDHLDASACFPAEVIIRDGEAFAKCGYSSRWGLEDQPSQGEIIDRATIVYATVE